MISCDDGAEAGDSDDVSRLTINGVVVGEESWDVREIVNRGRARRGALLHLYSDTASHNHTRCRHALSLFRQKAQHKLHSTLAQECYFCLVRQWTDCISASILQLLLFECFIRVTITLMWTRFADGPRRTLRAGRDFAPFINTRNTPSPRKAVCDRILCRLMESTPDYCVCRSAVVSCDRHNSLGPTDGHPAFPGQLLLAPPSRARHHHSLLVALISVPL